MLEISRSGAMPVVHGVALPHYRLPGIEEPELGLVRCRAGLQIEQEASDGEGPPPVHAIIFLVSPQEHPGRHLRTLANLAGRIEDPEVLERWMEARNGQELKETLLRPERYVAVELSDNASSDAYVGQPIGALDLPSGLYIGFMARDGQSVTPHDGRKLRSGDRLTFIGDPIEIDRIRRRHQVAD
jgi:hypothetical protein